MAPPYRSSLALFLLALYVFIATPVQWWHHHPAAQATVTAPAKEAGKAGIKTVASTQVKAPDCPVCTHQYAVHQDDHAVPAQLAAMVFPSIETTALVSPCERPTGHLSNKSPPVFAC